MARDRSASTLGRLDERLKNIEADIAKLVTRSEFEPVRIIVFGLVGSVLVAVLSALVGKVLH